MIVTIAIDKLCKVCSDIRPDLFHLSEIHRCSGYFFNLSGRDRFRTLYRGKIRCQDLKFLIFHTSALMTIQIEIAVIGKVCNSSCIGYCLISNHKLIFIGQRICDFCGHGSREILLFIAAYQRKCDLLISLFLFNRPDLLAESVFTAMQVILIIICLKRVLDAI